MQINPLHVNFIDMNLY